MSDPVPLPETPGQHCARWLKAAKKECTENNTVLTWDRVEKIIDATLTGLGYFGQVNAPVGQVPPPNTQNGHVKAEKGEFLASEGIYDAYPRKVGRKTAIEAIEKAVKRVAEAHDLSRFRAREHIMKSTKLFAEAVSKWPADERNFCPHPATWFNQGRYDDDPKEWIRGKQPAAIIQKDYSKLG